MSIVMFLGSSIDEYRVKALEYLEQQVFYCNICGCKMIYHGHYERGIRESGETIKVNRLCCQNKICRHTEAVLPDFLMPGKQYGADEIEAVLMDSSTQVAEKIETSASVSTARRWIRQVGEKIYELIPTLKLQLLSIGGFVNEENEITINEMRSGGLSAIEQLGRFLNMLHPVPKCGNILGAALIYISKRTHKLIGRPKSLLVY